MRSIARVLVAFVGVSHVGFLILEMFYWNEPVGREIFNTTPEFTASTQLLAANQGLYNGFLAAGLLWGLFSGRRDLKIFFLCCVIVAGVYGGVTPPEALPYNPGVPGPAPPLPLPSTRPARPRRRLQKVVSDGARHRVRRRRGAVLLGGDFDAFLQVAGGGEAVNRLGCRHLPDIDGKPLGRELRMFLSALGAEPIEHLAGHLELAGQGRLEKI